MSKKTVRMQSGEIQKQVSLEYQLIIPDDISEKKPKPLLVFLCGMGERTSYIDKVDEFCISKYIPEDYKDKFIIMTPLCPPDDAWRPDCIKFGIERVKKEFPVSKVYGAGYSLGGRGLWDTATEYPNLFSAICPFAGYTSYARADKIMHLPVMCLHGKKDNVVPLAESQKMIKNLGKNAELLTFDGGHYGWNSFYVMPMMYEFFLEH